MLTEQTVYIMKKRSCGEDLNAPGEKTKKKKVPDFSRTFLGGGRNRTRTCDPIDVNDVLYRLSHATVYINYDGYATYSMTFKPKAKVGLMTAGWTSCFHDGMPLAFFC